MKQSVDAIDFVQAQTLSSSALRAAIRSGAYRGQTAGLAAGLLQANLVILPESEALDFMRFCQRNPQACPLVGVSDTGSVEMPFLAQGLDISTDVPSYNVYHKGQLQQQCTDIRSLWRDDLVTFALGCSFTFEQALMSGGLPLYHIQHNTTVPMYRTSVPCRPAGKYRGTMVVSMRMLEPDQIQTASDICSHFPHAHGMPVHHGDPTTLGIRDLQQPDWGDPVAMEQGQVPVFWACGVTSQNALESAMPELCISHTPGHMLVTDVPERQNPPLLAADS